MTKLKSKKEHGVTTKEYVKTLAHIKSQIKKAQVKAVLAANKELIKLYWSLGKTITEKQNEYGWGSSFVEKLAQDLQSSFPGIAGFSRANVFKMKAFYQSYEKVSQVVRQFENLPIFSIPWGHNVVLITKIKSPAECLWYAKKTIEYGWSRSMLETWIKSDLYHREGKAATNFKKTLPMPDSDLAQQSFKDPYIFDFLTLHGQHTEHDIEQGLINNVQKLLLERI
jgi:predicted nuclease of restriction endonuclease-like (RecB) superfamily